jgi:hypothetical protein
MLIKSKQGQVNTYMEMAKMYRDMGNLNESRTCMMDAGTLMKDTKELSAGLHDLANDWASNSVKVTEYLKRGQLGMGTVEESANNKTLTKKIKIVRKSSGKSPKTQLNGTEELDDVST